jgi:hypothetical protein
VREPDGARSHHNVRCDIALNVAIGIQANEPKYREDGAPVFKSKCDSQIGHQQMVIAKASQPIAMVMVRGRNDAHGPNGRHRPVSDTDPFGS